MQRVTLKHILLGVAVKRNVVFYSCCEEPFPDVTFSIQLRRRTKYYFMNIIIPCIILSFLCLGGFLLPPESGEKITLGLSVLLTITVFMLMVADKMPQTSESISVISIYLMVVLATSCLSVLSSVLVLSIHHQRGRPSRPPLWLRRLCFSLVARMLRLVQIRDTYATEFGNGKEPSEKKKIRFEGYDETKQCCHSNCRSPGRNGSKLDINNATARYKIAKSSHDGYIEMRTQVRHNSYPLQCRCRIGTKRPSDVSCQCYTSRVYVPSQQETTSVHTPSAAFNVHRPSTHSTFYRGHQEHACYSVESNAKCFSDGEVLANNLRHDHDHLKTRNSQSYRAAVIASDSPECRFQLRDTSEGQLVCEFENSSGDGPTKGNEMEDIEKGESAKVKEFKSDYSCDEDSLSNSGSDSEDNQTFCKDPTQTSGSQQQEILIHDHSVTNDTLIRKSKAATLNTAQQQPSQNATYRTILRYLLNLVHIRQEQEVTEVKDEELYKEWHDLAFVLDRLLFYLFFFVTLVSTVGILEMRPETEPL
ncbi:neuronal acetylcholine receptor subunit alpha-10 [Elysia marginata]|uniref:Neuronal acetylcholine receptor subunit alpha-10 n=1 Tax=Elysia marginata TaxID=1093978 RepID=A0AAV4H1I6_9GAST|nr:neuronal acetylcholine receptor subunit alpha-10 [Elysia marginata]